MMLISRAFLKDKQEFHCYLDLKVAITDFI